MILIIDLIFLVMWHIGIRVRVHCSRLTLPSWAIMITVCSQDQFTTLRAEFEYPIGGKYCLSLVLAVDLAITDRAAIRLDGDGEGSPGPIKWTTWWQLEEHVPQGASCLLLPMSRMPMCSETASILLLHTLYYKFKIAHRLCHDAEASYDWN